MSHSEPESWQGKNREAGTNKDPGSKIRETGHRKTEPEVETPEPPEPRNLDHRRRDNDPDNRNAPIMPVRDRETPNPQKGVKMNGMPSIEDQYIECRDWAEWLREAGYEVLFSYNNGEPEPFDREWQVWTKPSGTGKRIATIDIDGCGASWHGPDDLFRKVIWKRMLQAELAEIERSE